MIHLRNCDTKLFYFICVNCILVSCSSASGIGVRVDIWFPIRVSLATMSEKSVVNHQ
ncbi:hypothetical protein M438DRAFT_188528 [Aureobasidium pullulans EXF-150]|uniref:Uncharacterized protein n=1 Tax=Aureobasidium pullulans EXF-150 TaxID=1043002 RepID=A0A074XKG8_AURPU|nr:uncharacterized protein M438DRAFT_188528 [Aureobasidium pullulans EXF-150]KEQ86010.1 hypothetical protein M438DRAFT_188528 [Aureobasidium pullulans EXF-150]